MGALSDFIKIIKVTVNLVKRLILGSNIVQTALVAEHFLDGLDRFMLSINAHAKPSPRLFSPFLFSDQEYNFRHFCLIKPGKGIDNCT